MPTGVQRVDLRAEEVEVEMGMLLADLGRMVRPAVMALREDGDRIDIGLGKCLGRSFFGVEARADAGNPLGGVEVEMDLPVTHGMSCLGFSGIWCQCRGLPAVGKADGSAGRVEDEDVARGRR